MTKTDNIFDEATATALPSSDEDEGEIEDFDSCTPQELELAFKTRFQLQDESAVTLGKDYILNLCADAEITRIAAGLSNGSVQLFDVNSSRGLTPVDADFMSTKLTATNPNEPINICGVRFLDETPHLILVGTTDGLIRLFDLRTNGEQARFEQQNEIEGAPRVPKSITTFDRNANGRILCAGTEQFQHNVHLLFYDVRERKPLGGYSESHEDDITAVSFHAQNPDWLCTGSTDGLINTFDIKESSEDDALMNTINTESSVQKLSWHNNVYEKDVISCVTHTNDFKAYESLEGDEIVSFDRDDITAGIRRKNAANFNLINAHTVDNNGGLMLLAGTNFNKGEVLRSVRIANKDTLKPWTDFQGNKQIVRDSLYNAKHNVLITGGECGIVTVWTPKTDDSSVNSVAVGNKLKAKTKLKSHKATPY